MQSVGKARRETRGIPRGVRLMRSCLHEGWLFRWFNQRGWTFVIQFANPPPLLPPLVVPASLLLSFTAATDHRVFIPSPFAEYEFIRHSKCTWICVYPRTRAHAFVPFVSFAAYTTAPLPPSLRISCTRFVADYGKKKRNFNGELDKENRISIELYRWRDWYWSEEIARYRR